MSYAANLAMTLPEVILALGAIALMLVAAWGGPKSTRAISWAAVAVLVGATIALAGPASSGGEAFGGLYRADAFAAFCKVLIFGAAGVGILMAPDFFQRTSGDDLRPEYPVLILLSACGMGMMVSAADMLTLYVGLELQSLAAYVLASFMRRDTRSAEAGLKYFVLARSPAASCCTASRWSTASRVRPTSRRSRVLMVVTQSWARVRWG